MIHIEVGFKVECSGCGREIDADLNESTRNGRVVEVKPCEHCLDDKYKEGFDEGHYAGVDSVETP